MALNIGDQAPDFVLPSDEHRQVSLKDFRGKKIILYFYPKDDTPGCTRQARDFRDAIDVLTAADTIVIGISKDSTECHQKFKQKHQLPFMLLTDKTGDVCQAYGIFKPKSLFGKSFLGIQRSTFLIDEQGTIRAIWRNVKVKEHMQQVLNELQ